MNETEKEAEPRSDTVLSSGCVEIKTCHDNPSSKNVESSAHVHMSGEEATLVPKNSELRNSHDMSLPDTSTTEIASMSDCKKVDDRSETIRPKTPENNHSGLSTPSTASPNTPRDGIPPLVGIEGYCSSASTSSTPREGSSSGSPSPIPDEVGKISSKDKLRVTLGKDISLMMQALNSLQSPEEKIAALCKKYADLLDQQKVLKKQLKISQKSQGQAAKQKEKLQMEGAKTLVAKTKLESLCRELQKHNKAIKDEKTQKSLEEISLRQEMAAEFQTTLNRIQNQMKTAVDGSSMLQSENERIGGKLNEIVEKYQAREVAMENLVKQHHLQEELACAQLKKAVLEHEEERERDEEEKQRLLEHVVERTVLYEAKVKQEKELRTQLQYYSEKFEDFQSTLEKSNEIFASFRSEMDKMSKKLKQTEKHRTTIQKKWEDSTKALADTVDYTQQLEAKQARLESLSRALQAERNDLAQRLLQYEDDTKKTKEGNKRKKNRNEKSKKETTTIRNEKSSNFPIESHNRINSELKQETTKTSEDPRHKGDHASGQEGASIDVKETIDSEALTGNEDQSDVIATSAASEMGDPCLPVPPPQELTADVVK